MNLIFILVTLLDTTKKKTHSEPAIAFFLLNRLSLSFNHEAISWSDRISNLLIKKVRCQSERLGDFVKYQPGKYCGEIYEFEVKQYI